MNRIIINHTTIASALLLSVSTGFAQVQVQARAGGQSSAQSGGKSSGKLVIEASDPLDGDSAVMAEAIEIRIDDGKVSVKRNGKEVPQDQIRREDDGRIIILDENGKELQHLGAWTDAFDSGNFFRFGGGEDGNMFWTGQAPDEGPAPKVMLGVHMGEPREALEKHLGLDSGKTTMITGVHEGLPADSAGLGEYDIIIAVDGNTPADAASIKEALAGKDADDTVTFRVIQSGTKREIKVKLEAYDAEKMQRATLHGVAQATPFGNFDAWRRLNNLNDHIIVAPGNAGEWKEHLQALQGFQGIQPHIEQLQPLIEKHLHEAMKKHQGDMKSDDGADDKDVEAQLNRLDKRMADLEKMLQKLIEKQ